jgi:glycosyltransferase involved in cell wall biosynthesis
VDSFEVPVRVFLRILCVIDSLGSGGAQRQMVNLATGLKLRGHDVEMFIYQPHLNFFHNTVDEKNIRIHEISDVNGFSFRVVKNISRLIQSRHFDALISFLPSPNIYCILAKLLSRTNIRLIIGERASKSSDTGFLFFLSRHFLYLFANKVVVNSYHQTAHLRTYFSLRRKVSTIYNGYFVNNIPNVSECKVDGVCGFLVIGRVDAHKNGIALLQALTIFHKRNGYLPTLSWAGRQELDKQSLAVRAEMDRVITQNPELQMRWQWLGERSDISLLLANCDALIHVSLHEGLPNVICEAFIAGRPVIASSVCDHPLLVEDGVRGLLCDPLSPESICSAIERFIALPVKDREAMSHNARRYAEEYLSLDRMVFEYEELLT